jgi:hypothetical protein
MYWIDIEVSSAEPGRRPRASIRVALCNPPEVGPALRNLLETLWGRGGGRLVDLSGDRRWETVDDEVWQGIWKAYDAKRREFHQNFGDFEAAISGAKVFPLMREKGLR